MYSHKCYRSLDKPITICGMEAEDIVIIVLISGVIYFILSGIVAVGCGLLLSYALKSVKSGRPRGYLFYLLYSAGVFNYFSPGVPNIFRLKTTHEGKIFLSPVASRSEVFDCHVKYWYAGKRIFL